MQTIPLPDSAVYTLTIETNAILPPPWGGTIVYVKWYDSNGEGNCLPVPIRWFDSIGQEHCVALPVDPGYVTVGEVWRRLDFAAEFSIEETTRISSGLTFRATKRNAKL